MNPTDTITDKQGRIACPASFEHAALLTDYKIHFASPSQIAKFGVCRKCRARMKKNGAAILAGKTELPAEMTVHRHELTPDEDHAGSVASGEMVQTTDFDFAAVDEALGLVETAPADARAQAGEVLRQIFAYCFQSKRKLNLRTAAAKLAVIGAGLRPDALADESQTELAAQLGLTKAALSKTSVKFQDAFGVKFSRSRSLSARGKMRARRLGGPGRHRKADGQAGGGGPKENC